MNEKGSWTSLAFYMLLHLIHTTYGCLLVLGSVPALARSPGPQESRLSLGGRCICTLGFAGIPEEGKTHSARCEGSGKAASWRRYLLS